MGCACGKTPKTKPGAKPQPSKTAPSRPKLKLGEAAEARSSSKIFSDQQKPTPEIVIVPSKHSNLKQQSLGQRTPAERALSISEQPPAIYAEALKQLKSPPGEPEELRSALRRSPSNRRSVAPKTQSFAEQDVFKNTAKNLDGIETRKIYHLKSSTELLDQRETLAKARKSVSAIQEQEKLEKAFVGPARVEGPKLTLKGRPILGTNHSGAVVGEQPNSAGFCSLDKIAPLTPLKPRTKSKDYKGLLKEQVQEQATDPNKQKPPTNSRSGKQLVINLSREPLSSVRREGSMSSKRLSLRLRGSGEKIIPFDENPKLPRLAEKSGDPKLGFEGLEIEISPVKKSHEFRFSAGENSVPKGKQSSWMEPTDRETRGQTKDSQALQSSSHQNHGHQLDQQLTLSNFHPLQLTAKHKGILSLYDIRKPSLTSSRRDNAGSGVVERNLRSGGDLADKMPQNFAHEPYPSSKQVVLSSCSSEEVNRAFNRALDQGHLNDHRPQMTLDSGSKRKSIRGKEILQSVKNLGSLPNVVMSVEELTESKPRFKQPSASKQRSGVSPADHHHHHQQEQDPDNDEQSRDLSLALALESKSLEDSHAHLSFVGSVV